MLFLFPLSVLMAATPYLSAPRHTHAPVGSSVTARPKETLKPMDERNQAGVYSRKGLWFHNIRIRKF